MAKPSLTSLMNDMIDRIDEIHPVKSALVAEERYWQMITLYIRIDPVLAQLYKQYCDAKNHLGQLLAGPNPNDAMAEIAWDMHDSLRGAIETRLIELRENSDTPRRVKALQQEQANKARHFERQKNNEQSIEDLVAFMLWIGLVMRDAPGERALHADFGHAC